jgi:hypothetical protein
MRFLLSGRARWAALGVIVGALAAGGIAYASIPDTGGMFHACYKTVGGQVRLVESANDCNGSETATTWSQTGQLAWAHVAGDGTVLGSSGNVTVARASPGVYCVGVAGGTSHAAMAVLDSAANVGGTIQTGVFSASGCPSNADDILIVTRPHGQDGGIPGADRAYYLAVS